MLSLLTGVTTPAIATAGDQYPLCSGDPSFTDENQINEGAADPSTKDGDQAHSATPLRSGHETRSETVGVVVEKTPNPRALKFTVESPVGGPATFSDSGTADERVAPILGLDGVVSVFITANFITVTRSEDASWDDLAEPITKLVEATFT